MADISNSANNTLIVGTNDADSIVNYINSVDVTINAVAGNDSIRNYGSNVTIGGGTGDDSIRNVGTYIESSGGSNPTLRGTDVLINGDDGNDSIWNNGTNITINGGAGNDSIENFNDSVTIDGDADDDFIQNVSDSVTIDGGDGNDSIGNDGDLVTINGGAGDDYIENFARLSELDGYGGTNVTIDGGTGNDSIYNFRDSVTIDGGAGDDYIQNFAHGEYSGSNVTIGGGAGNDLIYNDGANASINAGTGNDLISLVSASGNVIQYTEGDGHDTVWGYGDTNSLQINSASPWSSVTVGNDIVVTVGDGSITLVDAASLYGGGGTESIPPVPVTPVNPAAPTDVVFIIDKSGSMSDKIQKVKDAIISFANSLENSNADFRFGVVVFDGPDEIIPYTFTAADGTSSYFTNNITDFTTVVNTITDDGHSGSEYGLTAIQTALLTGLREGVSRRFVVLTDEGYGENSSDYVTSTDIETALKAANVKMDVVGRMGTDCQTEYEPLANSTGGKFYDIDSLSYYNYFEEIADDILGRAHVNINLDTDNVPEGTTSGVFVVTPTVNAAGATVPASSDATFKAAAEEGDYVVGYVIADKAYTAVADSPWRQIVTVPDNWIVSGTYQDDALNVTGSNAVISGSLGKDNISINEDAVNTTLVDVSELQNGSDTLSFSKRVTPGTLQQNFTGGGVALYTTDEAGALDFVINLPGIAALDESLLNCEVSNAGKPNTIRELIYGEVQQFILNDTLEGRIMFAQWGYGFTPTKDNPLYGATTAATTATTDLLATSADLAENFGSPSLDEIAPANFAVTQDNFSAQNFNALETNVTEAILASNKFNV